VLLLYVDMMCTPAGTTPPPPATIQFQPLKLVMSNDDVFCGLSPEDISLVYAYKNFNLIVTTLQSCDLRDWLQHSDVVELGAGAHGRVVQGLVPWPAAVWAEVEAKFGHCPLLLQGLPVVAKMLDISPQCCVNDHRRDMRFAKRETQGNLLANGRDLFVNVAKQKVMPFDSSVLVPRLLMSQWLPPVEGDREEHSSYILVFQPVTGQPLSLQSAVERGVFKRHHGTILSLASSLKRQLEKSHQRGIVHQDVKPQNVVVGESSLSVLVDWSLVGNVGAPAELSGTALYVSSKVSLMAVCAEGQQ
jgi:hypothetical protein